MSKVSCESCDNLIEVFGNVLQLPYICIRCEKDSALAIEQDVWETEYVGPACQQAAEEVHGLYEEDNISCDAPYNSGVPCQSALDSVQEEQYLDPYCVGETDPGVHAMHSGDVLDQFNADTEIINDLREQLDGTHATNASLTEEIELCDKRVRAYQQAMAETDKHAAGLEGTIEILKSELRGISIRANDAVLDTSV